MKALTPISSHQTDFSHYAFVPKPGWGAGGYVVDLGEPLAAFLALAPRSPLLPVAGGGLSQRTHRDPVTGDGYIWTERKLMVDGTHIGGVKLTDGNQRWL